MDDDDPWFWDTDRVVVELCTHRQSRIGLPPHARVPDPGFFERALRENDISGYNLLNDLDDSALRDDLGIRNLGQRATVKYAIKELKKRSKGFLTYNNRHAPQSFGEPCLIDDTVFSSMRRGSERSTAFDNYRTSRDQPGLSLIDASSEEIRDGPTNATKGGYGNADITTEPASKRHKTETEIQDTRGESAVCFAESSLECDVSSFQAEVLHNESRQSIPLRTSNTIDSIPIEKKRKRLAPTLITSFIDPNRDRAMPTAADNIIINVAHEPGEIWIGTEGRKRMVPVSLRESDLSLKLQQGGKKGLEAARTIIERIPPRVQFTPPLDIGYLGRSSDLADDVFFGDISVGEELISEDPGDFSHTSTSVSAGRRLYRYHLVRKFFRSEWRIVQRQNKRFSTRVPYSRSLVPPYKCPTFTLFHANTDGNVVATREALDKWPEADPDIESLKTAPVDADDPRQIQFQLPFLGTNSYDDFDESMLEKWRNVEGGDAVLPVYGDSDSENDYDIDTWNEIEKENGVIEKPEYVSQRPRLSAEEITQAIDEGIARLVLKWNAQRLPKLKRQAFKLWKKTRDRRESRRRQIREWQSHLDRLNNDRIPKFRKEILSEQWTRPKQVHQQMRVMEQSVYDREDLAWKISLIECKEAPPKPVEAEENRKIFTPLYKSEMESGESIQSESDSDISDDGLEGFIVSDSPGDIPDGAHDLLDETESEAFTSDDEHDTSTISKLRQRANDKVPKSTLLDSQSDTFSSHSDEEPSSSEPMLGMDILEGTRSQSTSPIESPLILKHEREPLRIVTKSTPAMIHEVIDLITSSSEMDEYHTNSTSRPVDLVTPTKPFLAPPIINPKDTESNHKSSLFTKKENMQRSEEIVIVSDSDRPSVDSRFQPKLADIEGILAAGRHFWTGKGDEERLLIAVIAVMPKTIRSSLFNMISSIPVERLWSTLLEVLLSVAKGHTKVKGIEESSYQSYKTMGRLYRIFITCSEQKSSSIISKPTVKEFLESQSRFPRFRTLCFRTLKLLDGGAEHSNQPASSNLECQEMFNDEDDEPRSGKRRHKASRGTTTEEDSELPSDPPPRKLRKRKVVENVQARSQREQDQARQEEQEARRKVLHAKLAGPTDSLNVDTGRIIVNDAKREEEGFVYVNELIARRIKKHQIEGVRFMWSQIIESSSQGCLLAHTMGLGKTMQVYVYSYHKSESL